MSQQLLCPSCQVSIDSHDLFCPSCGLATTPLEAPTLPGTHPIIIKGRGDVTCLPCPSCKILIAEDSSFCKFCGAAYKPLTRTIPSQTTRPKRVNSNAKPIPLRKAKILQPFVLMPSRILCNGDSSQKGDER